MEFLTDFGEGLSYEIKYASYIQIVSETAVVDQFLPNPVDPLNDLRLDES